MRITRKSNPIFKNKNTFSINIYRFLSARVRRREFNIFWIFDLDTATIARTLRWIRRNQLKRTRIVNRILIGCVLSSTGERVKSDRHDCRQLNRRGFQMGVRTFNVTSSITAPSSCELSI